MQLVRRAPVRLAALLLSWAVAGPAHAEPVVDSEVGGPGNGTSIVGNARDLAQTFTAGQDGVITRVDVTISIPTTAPVPYDLELDLRETTPEGAPVESDEPVLDGRRVPAAAFPNFLEPLEPTAIEDLAVAVAAGDVLALVLRSPTSPENTAPYDWHAGPFGDPYPGGARFCRGAEIALCENGWAPLSGDQQFRIWVDPTLRLDAVVTDPPNGLSIVGGERDLAQTFTVATTGVLQRIDLKLQIPTTVPEDRELVVDVRPVGEDGAPVEDDEAALATRVLAMADVPDFLEPRRFTVLDGLGIPVQAGDRLAVVLRTPDVPAGIAPFDWFNGPFGDPYAGGSMYCRGAEIPLCEGGWADLDRDAQFRVLVEVPEPGAAGLGLAAAGALAVLRRRRGR